MKIEVGSLVSVLETRGSGEFLRKTDLGCGVVLGVSVDRSINFRGVGNVSVGRSVRVALQSGKIETFNEKDIVKVYQ